MKYNNEIAQLEKAINKDEREIEYLTTELMQKSTELEKRKKRLYFLKNNGKDELPAGTKLLFKDEDDIELEFIIVVDYKGRYNVVLLTEYSEQIESMCEYHVLDYNCNYIDTLVERLEDDYSLTFIKVIEED